ncbi:MAG: hypothetical protein JW829_20710 [Pirellulales bacterium]|nr:hypothetical protein [Pirellulales bacterium]
MSLALLAAWNTSPALFAGPINYGDYPGNTVMFLQVMEDANSFGDVPPLFGAPTVTGDSLDFSPVGFSASASGANGVDITDGNLAFGIQASPMKFIDTILFTEAGDTTLAGMGTVATLTSVTCEVFIDILEVDGIPINQINLQKQLVFTPSNGDFSLGADGGGGPLYQTAWHGSLMVDFTQELIDRGISFTYGATRAMLNLDNTLIALSENGTQSMIAKKDADGVTITVNIPEPATWVLAWISILATLWIRRLRRA